MAKVFLQMGAAKKVLGIAMTPGEDYRLCPQIAATRAAGDAVLSLSATTMKQNLQYLYNIVATRRGEVLIETMFLPKKFRKHTVSIKGLDIHFRRLDAEIAKVTAVVGALSALERPEVEECKEAISSAGGILRRTIKLMSNEAEDSSQLTSDEIKWLLRQKIARRLRLVMGRLADAIEAITTILNGAETEWKGCVDLLNRIC